VNHEFGRQTNRQTDRQAGRQAGRQADRQTDRQTESSIALAELRKNAFMFISSASVSPQV